jgi:hypothetical protein
MTRYAPGLLLGAVLALGTWLLAGAGTRAFADDEDEKEIKAAQADVVGLVQAQAKGEKVDADRVKAVFVKGGKNKYDELNHVMQVFKPSTRKGLSVFGPKGATDGIEVRLNVMVKKDYPPPSKDAIRKMEAELLEATRVSLVMAEVARLYPPKKPVDGKGVKEWNQYSDDLKKSSLELAAATKAGNGTDLKKAVEAITNACNGCHSDFRGK